MSGEGTIGDGLCCVGAAALAPGERLSLGLRLGAAMASVCLLLLALGTELIVPEQTAVVALLEGLSALLVAVPVLVQAGRALGGVELTRLTDVLVSVALLAAWIVGDLRTAALVPLAMVLAHVLEDRSVMGAREALDGLGRLARVPARVLDAAGVEHAVPATAVAIGDRVAVRAGDRLPVDGQVVSGHASCDTSAITGESLPREVGPGDAVQAGWLDLDGALVLTATGVGAETAIGRVADLLRSAGESKPPVTRVLDRHAGRYLPLVLVLALLVLFTTGSVSAMMALLVVSCPCALAIAAPASAVATIAAASRQGVLVKGTAFLERLAEADTLILDKTGTLTTGELSLCAVCPAVGVDHDELLATAAALAAGSRHPISRAVAAAWDGALPELTTLHEQRGRGLSASCAGAPAVLGNVALLREVGVTVSEQVEHDGPAVACAHGGRFLGWLCFRDPPRAEAAEVLAALRAAGVSRQVMVTGDRRPVAERIASEVGITQVQAEALPEDKLRLVEAELAAGRIPVVVGDGINDALALRQGAVGVAFGPDCADIAHHSADIVVLASDLGRLVSLLRLARSARRTIGVNVLIALGWTLVMVALAATGTVGPLTAALLHNGGAVLVLLNAGRLLHLEP
ncbi:MAG: heavy metal translocating P-type ATPase [Planctomycetota bacterium]